MQAKINHKQDRYLLRIQTIQPGIQIKTADWNDEGLINDVVVVNGETVFRFARSETGIKALQEEMRVIETIRAYVSLALPKPFHVSQEMIAYPLLKGEALTRRLLANLSETDRQAVGRQIATFLMEMHHVPIDDTLPSTSAPVHFADWLAIHKSVQEVIYPLLMKHQREWAEQLFNSMLQDEQNFEYTPGIIHGDLSCYHILFDPAAKRVSGVIDFGVAGIGDPANDIACLMQYYGETFVQSFVAWYPHLDEQMLRRARFYAQALELQWVLNGLRSGENFWFTAHIGNARDIRHLAE